MSLPAVQNPFETILGLAGTGLNGGKVYIGEAGMDPQTNPKAVFWDAAGTVPALQPLPTAGGYIMRLGSPARAFVALPYSLRITTSTGVLVFYEPNVTSGYSAVIDELLAAGTEAEARAALGIPDYSAVIDTFLGADTQEEAREALGITNNAQVDDQILGLTLRRNALSGSVTVNTDPGSCRDATGVHALIATTSFAKNLNGAWVAGSGMGGLDAGASTANTWYHLHIIYNPTTLANDRLFSTSFNNPTLPTGFTVRRYLGSVKTDLSGDIVPFIQSGEWFWFKDQVNDVAAAANGVPDYQSISTPTGAKAEAEIYVEGQRTTYNAAPSLGNTNDSWLSFRDPDRGDYANQPDQAYAYRRANTAGPTVQFYIDTIRVTTDNLGRIFTGSTNITDEFISIRTKGWTVDRSVYR